MVLPLIGFPLEELLLFQFELSFRQELTRNLHQVQLVVQCLVQENLMFDHLAAL